MPKTTTATNALFLFIYILILNTFSNQTMGLTMVSLPVGLLFLLILFSISHMSIFLYRIISTLSIIVASSAIFYKWRYQVIITEDILLSGIINDYELTMELLTWPFLIWLAITAFLPIWVLWNIKIRKSTLFRYLLLVTLIVVSIFSFVLLNKFEYRKKGQIRDYKIIQAIGSFSPVDVLYAFKKALKAKSKLEQKYLKSRLTANSYNIKNIDNDRLIVVIIGESTRGDHFSINGYKRETTPKIKNLKNVYSFTNAKSCDTITIRSLNYMMSPLLCNSADSDVSKASWVEIMHSLGYGVELYSLQTLNALYHYLTYDKLLSKYAIVAEQETGTRDVSLLPYITKSINEYKSGKKLIIIHTLGSHQRYYDRIMDDKRLFKPSCTNTDVSECTYNELLNSYDNTIVGIDSFIFTVSSLLQDKKAMLIYLSDHGESLGENGIYFHGQPRVIAPKEQFDIPFIFWFSDKYKNYKEYSMFMKRTNDNGLDMNITHDYLFHSVLGCSGVDSNDTHIYNKLNLCGEY